MILSLPPYLLALGRVVQLSNSQPCMQTFPEWGQLLVKVDPKDCNGIRVVYLDTSLQRLLYEPSITAVDSNLASKHINIVQD